MTPFAHIAVLFTSLHLVFAAQSVADVERDACREAKAASLFQKNFVTAREHHSVGMAQEINPSDVGRGSNTILAVMDSTASKSMAAVVDTPSKSSAIETLSTGSDPEISRLDTPFSTAASSRLAMDGFSFRTGASGAVASAHAARREIARPQVKSVFSLQVGNTVRTLPQVMSSVTERSSSAIDA